MTIKTEGIEISYETNHKLCYRKQNKLVRDHKTMLYYVHLLFQLNFARIWIIFAISIFSK